MLSQTVEYALRAVVYLAGRSSTACTNGQIADATKVPAAYLSKVMQALHRGELVQAQRGVNGGFRLMKDPEQLTILEVVNAVEPIQRIRTCPLGLAAHGKRLCPLHKRVDDALATMEKAFGDTTLAEVLAEPTSSVPLCEFPRESSKRNRRADVRAAKR
ncbi:MAG TPA: Rrf2 family transcriptional regulator [Pirellulales bacterium]|jgi:Rrf2 family protein|nr:Rrf2 family transcriptional regulator [Pirellulales bacterium]